MSPEINLYSIQKVSNPSFPKIPKKAALVQMSNDMDNQDMVSVPWLGNLALPACETICMKFTHESTEHDT